VVGELGEVTPGQADEHETPRHWGLVHRPGRDVSTHATRRDPGVAGVVDFHPVHMQSATICGHARSRVELGGQRDDAHGARHEMIDVLAAQSDVVQRMPTVWQRTQLSANGIDSRLA
jgi:hypothetical protein